MSFNSGNSAGERQNRRRFGQAGYSIIKRRALLRKMKPMSPEQERRAIEAFIEKHGVRKVVLVPPPKKPIPKPVKPGVRWTDAETEMLRTLKAKRFSDHRCAELMGRAYETIRKRSRALRADA